MVTTNTSVSLERMTIRAVQLCVTTWTIFGCRSLCGWWNINTNTVDKEWRSVRTPRPWHRPWRGWHPNNSSRCSCCQTELHDTDCYPLQWHWCVRNLQPCISTIVWQRMDSLNFSSEGEWATKTRFIPLHVIAVKVGKPMCEVLPATHALTGCYITSKSGTKAAGIKAEPVLYLKDFRMAHTDLQDCVQNAENSWYWPSPNKLRYRGLSMQPTCKSIACETFHWTHKTMGLPRKANVPSQRNSIVICQMECL